MMIPNPDDARKINKMHEKLMGTPNLPKEIEKPGEGWAFARLPNQREIDVTRQRK
jgi:hypothetical protein